MWRYVRLLICRSVYDDAETAESYQGQNRNRGRISEQKQSKTNKKEKARTAYTVHTYYTLQCKVYTSLNLNNTNTHLYTALTIVIVMMTMRIWWSLQKVVEYSWGTYYIFTFSSLVRTVQTRVYSIATPHFVSDIFVHGAVWLDNSGIMPGVTALLVAEWGWPGEYVCCTTYPHAVRRVEYHIYVLADWVPRYK